MTDYKDPETLVEGFFSTALKDKRTHPVLLALKSELENNRDNTNEKCRGSIELKLQIAVQKKAYKIDQRVGRKKEGVLILIAEVYAFKTTLTVNYVDISTKKENF